MGMLQIQNPEPGTEKICSNGCPESRNLGNDHHTEADAESGWTMYLDESWDATFQMPGKKCSKDNNFAEEEEEEEEESSSSSMVSDASSGPRQASAELLQSGGSCKRPRIQPCTEENDLMLQHLLEDTASSPVSSSKSELTINNGGWLGLFQQQKQQQPPPLGSAKQIRAEAKALDCLHCDTAACRDETLGLAMECAATSMDIRIQADAASQADEGFLRKRSLRFVPISALFSAI